MRITKVYTKAGDAGETSLVGGQRVSKASVRVAAFGDVDELNSLLGVARTFLADQAMDETFGRIQNELFVLGADLASPMDVPLRRVDESMVSDLEQLIDKLLEELEPLQEFILPGGNQAGALLHLARTVGRRAERSVVALAAQEATNPQALIYLNRLSDFLFVAARVVNRRAGVREHLAQFSARNK
ncbi:MAG TPA: cob(I)yrinic acid a,c-diamide adenosyltransferase [Blastocatellia bacterium]|nr:cob(I)yrinic acid a,c-diamide adenosyltransferase [Blastocatellia bacterium]